MNTISCEACGNQISVNAENCPKCGNPNTWVHPKIKAFIEQGVSTSRQYTYQHQGAQIQGQSLGASGHTWGVGLLVVGALLVTIGVPSIGGALIIFGGFVEVYLMFFGSRPTTFQLDLATDPPRWESDNEKLWQPVKDFFGVR